MSIYQFHAPLISGEELSFENFMGKTLLIVNTASACGFTHQYEEFQELYRRFHGKGLEILAFPCNQFGSQESGSHEEIKQFCDLKFKISFPLFQKVDVNGDNAHPLFSYLKDELPGLLGSKAIKWNFTKFLIDKDGRPLERIAPKTAPLSLIPKIQKIL